MVKTHIVYVALIAVLLFFGHVWLSEHDARVQAESTIKGLKSQITTTDAQAVKDVAKVRTIVRTVRTPAQVVSVVPQLTDAPLNTRVATDNPSQVSVDATVFVNLLAQAKTDSINLAACKSDLQNTNAEVVALKKKPKFWHRVKGDLELVATGGIVVATLIVLHGWKL